ncbi:MAG: HEPN domain-containing protein [Acidobacteria bacterium]|nr:HEPN domain-containing protein [Acidobacteriota bacterium]
MTNRAPDWLRQAEADLEHAESAIESEDFEWSCFAAQQGAEKALKALYYHLHGDPWGHSLLALMQALPEPLRASVTDELLDAARALDKHYIPTRYPNGFAEGAPMDYYTKRDAEESLNHAKSILTFCQSEIRKPQSDLEFGQNGGETDSGRPS